MRVLNVNKFHYLKGGSERYYFDLTWLLEENSNIVFPFSTRNPWNLENRFESRFVSQRDYDTNDGVPGEIKKAVDVIYSAEARRKFSLMVEENPVDVVHLHNISHQLSPSIVMEAGRRKLPVVWTLHDYKVVCPAYVLFVNGGLCQRCGGGRFYNVVLRRCNRGSFFRSLTNCVEMYLHAILGTLKSVSFFLSPSRFLMEKVIEMGVDRGRVVHLPYFLKPGSYEPYFGDEGYFAYVGRFSREKGLTTLLSAAKKLERCRLKLIGGGELFPDVSGASRETPGIELTGYLSGKGLLEAWRRASFVVVPSEWYENLPYSILESFALGKPVIASRIGGIPELVIDGKTGFLFEPGNADELAEKISLLREKPELRDAMGRKAREMIEREFSPAAHYSRLSDIYRRAAGLRGVSTCE